MNKRDRAPLLAQTRRKFGAAPVSAAPPLTGVTSASLALCLAVSSCGAGSGRGSSAQEANTAQVERQAKAAAEKKPRAVVDPNKFALVITSAGGEEAYTKKFTDQATRLYDALANQLGFEEKNVFLLTETAGGGPEDGARSDDPAHSRRATAAEVRKSFAAIKSAANTESLVFIVLIGHGTFDAQQAKFNLIGPDLTARDYADLVAALPSRRVVFVNCASSSGEFIKPLSASGRVVITATRSGSEQNATAFAEHFIASLTGLAADADKNGRVSVLEAFNHATRKTADWYKVDKRLATEHALIDDNGDGTGHEEATGGDGPVAKALYVDSKPIEQAAGDAELARLLGERPRLEEAVEKLKARKGEMKLEDYERELEDLLVELATVNQQIKAKQK
ncbi:MAG TPA: hypothetical protein VLU47_05540 [Blastocatellia bacterium]|nr:hypothetical protein [Blastocatellia bacterium]